MSRRLLHGRVLTGSLNWALTSLITDLIDSSLANMSSCDVCSPPIMLDIYMTINAQSHGDCKRRAPYLANHGAEPRPKGAELPQRLLQHGREGEEAQSVARWSRIEDYHRIFHGFDIPGRSMRIE